MVEAAKANVDKAKAAADEVKKISLEWNQQHFQVLQLPLGESSKTIPAFPINEALYRDYGLKYTFTQRYIDAIRGLLKSLNPTRAPTNDEIQANQLEWERRLSLEYSMEEAKMRASGAISNPGAGGGAPAQPGAMTPDLAASAQAKALESAKISKAKAGALYANDQSMHFVFAQPESNPTDVRLWQAQLNLWVTRDIIEAINATNNDVFANNDKIPRNVLNAPVKRLVKITINGNYVITNPADAAAIAVAAPTTPAVAPGGRRREEEEDEGPRRQSVIAAPTAEAELQVGDVGTQQLASGLTHRASNPDYDVLHYSFTVVMPTRFLPVLERNLLSQNYHTVLEVQAAVPEKAVSLEGGAANDSQLYYYGTEPVMQVTIKGEMLLLTAWERGTVDAATNKFLDKYPPLVPAEMLQQQFPTVPPDAGNPALRPEDVARLTPATPEGAAEQASPQ
jgi:hypothetical protein